MRRTSKVLEGVRDGRGRLGRHLIVGGSELLMFFFCVEDAVDGGGPQPRGAIEVGGGLSQALNTRSPALILPVRVLVMSLPFVELLDI